MANYKKLYFKLFNKVSDTVEDLQDIQCEVEEEIINDDSNTPESDNQDEGFGVEVSYEEGNEKPKEDRQA